MASGNSQFQWGLKVYHVYHHSPYQNSHLEVSPTKKRGDVPRTARQTIGIISRCATGRFPFVGSWRELQNCWKLTADQPWPFQKTERCVVRESSEAKVSQVVLFFRWSALAHGVQQISYPVVMVKLWLSPEMHRPSIFVANHKKLSSGWWSTSPLWKIWESVNMSIPNVWEK